MKDQENTLTGEQILANVIALAPTVRESRDEIERERRLPVHLVDAMKKGGAFRIAMPREWGGPELDPMSQLAILEALSIADASVGWCAMIGCSGGYLTGFLEQKVAREMYPDIDVFTANALTPTGRALKVKDGYRVSGRWPFGSGCQHSTWLVGGCMVYEGDRQSFTSEGVPATRQCFFPTRDAEILDTWYTTGLRGSGSCDFAINDYFVPEERTFSYQDVKFYRSGPLYRFFANLLFHFPGPALGVARAAIDTLIDAGTRPRRLTTVGGKLQAGELRDDAFVQDAVGRAEAILAAARAYLFNTMSEVWDELVGGREIPPRLLAHFLMVHSHVYAMSTQAVELVYKARGGSSVYSSGLLDRCMRDALTMNQHVTNSLRSYGMAGRILLGLPGEFLLF
jgi:alkylation response protein AidB-like acyl-CoA dehydrogenase